MRTCNPTGMRGPRVETCGFPSSARAALGCRVPPCLAPSRGEQGCWAAPGACGSGAFVAVCPRYQRGVLARALPVSGVAEETSDEEEEQCELQDCQATLAFPLTLPILPFTPSEALAPGATKTIHLWEEKDIELLDAVLAGRGHGGAFPASPALPPVFVHTTIEMGGPWQPPVACASSAPGALVAGGFVFFLSTLVQVVSVERGPQGVDVTIRGEGRVRITRLRQLDPYITGEAQPLQDMVAPELLGPPQRAGVDGGAGSPRQALYRGVRAARRIAADVHRLLLKLGRGADAQRLTAALYWADTLPSIMCNLAPGSSAAELYAPTRAVADEGLRAAAPVLPCAMAHLDRTTRFTFALLQALPGGGGQAGNTGLHREAMCCLDTGARLGMALAAAREARARLAAQASLMAVRRAW